MTRSNRCALLAMAASLLIGGVLSAAQGSAAAKPKAVEEPEHLYLIQGPSRRNPKGKVQSIFGYREDPGLYGYMDKQGNVVVPMKFDRARRFSCGLAAVCVGKKWGYIDANGDYLVEPRFDYAHSFSEGFATANTGASFSFFSQRIKGGRWHIIDASGKVLQLSNVGEVGDFHDGRARFSPRGGRIGKWGYLDKDGKPVIAPTYGEAGRFWDGWAYVCVRYGMPGVFIDVRGKVVFDRDKLNVSLDSPFRFQEGLTIGNTGTGLRGPGFIDKTGKQVVPGRGYYYGMHLFSDGLSRFANRQGLWGYMDKQGKHIVEPQYPEAWDFREGLALVKTKAGRLQFIDKTGKVAFKLRSGFVDNQFDSTWTRSIVWYKPIVGFDHGLAWVGYYIDQTGKTVSPRQSQRHTPRPLPTTSQAATSSPATSRPVRQRR